jgi:hypothetical protein
MYGLSTYVLLAARRGACRFLPSTWRLPAVRPRPLPPSATPLQRPAGCTTLRPRQRRTCRWACDGWRAPLGPLGVRTCGPGAGALHGRLLGSAAFPVPRTPYPEGGGTRCFCLQCSPPAAPSLETPAMCSHFVLACLSRACVPRSRECCWGPHRAPSISFSDPHQRHRARPPCPLPCPLSGAAGRRAPATYLHGDIDIHRTCMVLTHCFCTWHVMYMMQQSPANLPRHDH